MVVRDKDGEIYFLKVIRKPLEGSYNFRNVPLSVKHMARIVKFYDLPSCYVFCIEYLGQNIGFDYQNNWKNSLQTTPDLTRIFNTFENNDSSKFHDDETLGSDLNGFVECPEKEQLPVVRDRFFVQNAAVNKDSTEMESVLSDLEESLSNSFGQTLTDERMKETLRRKIKEAKLEFSRNSDSSQNITHFRPISGGVANLDCFDATPVVETSKNLSNDSLKTSGTFSDDQHYDLNKLF